MSPATAGFRKWCAACVLAVFASAAAQADGDAMGYAFTGFGTLGAVTSSNHAGDFATSRTQPNGAGYSRDVAFGPDSRLGLQLDGHWSDLSGVIQAVAQQQPNGTYTPHIEWANLKYQLTPDWSVRAGRVALPVLMDSDYRLVGFASTMIRPPPEAYAIIPATSITGVDTSWRTHPGVANNTVQVLYGTFLQAFPANGSIRVPHAWGMADTVDLGPLTLRASFSAASLVWHAPQTDALLNSLDQFGALLESIPPLSAVGAQALGLNQYRVDGQWSYIESLGASYDKNSWIVMGEWVKMTRVGFIPTNRAGYLTVGYRIREFTPYVTAAALHTTALHPAMIPTQGLPPPLAAAAGEFNGGFQSLAYLQNFTQNTRSVGLRWDLLENLDVKLQVDNIHVGAGGPGEFVDFGPQFHPGTVNVVGLALDFVF